MSADRDVREVVIAGFEIVLGELGIAHSYRHHGALKLAAVAEAHGVRLARPAHLHDPNANWRDKPEPGDASVGAFAVRAALLGSGICTECDAEQLLREGVVEDHLRVPVNPDADDDECPGSGKPPRAVPVDEDQEHNDE